MEGGSPLDCVLYENFDDSCLMNALIIIILVLAGNHPVLYSVLYPNNISVSY